MPAKTLLRAGCVLGVALASSKVDDVGAMFQTRMEAQTMRESQAATLRLMSRMIGLDRLKWPSFGKHHSEESEESDEKHAKQKHSSEELVAGCSEADAKALEAHVKSTVAEYQPKFARALSAGDGESIKDLTDDLVPLECDSKKIGAIGAIKWGALESCLTTFTNISLPCAQCPIRFLQKVAGKTLMDAPLSCVMSCAPVAMEAAKCENMAEGCDEEILAKMAPCLQCANPKMIELSRCAGVPHANKIPMRLDKIMQAITAGQDRVQRLIMHLAKNGREELNLVVNSTALNQVIGLVAGAVMD